jgi:hypothetical protein
VKDWSEHGHDGVADELLDRSAETLELSADALKVGRQAGVDVLGIQLFRARSGPDDVREDGGDDATFFSWSSSRLCRKGRATRQTEPRLRRVRLPAGRTMLSR